MPKFSQFSLRNLEDVHPDLIDLFVHVIQHFDCQVTCGYRSVEEQQELYALGRTKPGNVVTKIDGITKKSKHNLFPAQAVDVTPYPVNYDDFNRQYMFAGFVMGMATTMNIPLRWGGDWDRDTDVHDQTFKDLPHFELYGYPES